MQIKLEKNFLISLSINDKHVNASEETEKEEVIFKYNAEFGDNEFFIVFEMALETLEGKILTLIYKSIFLTDGNIDDDFKRSKFPHINAPAIAYPFLRAYISTITLNSGFAPVMLPSINFVSLWDEKQKQI